MCADVCLLTQSDLFLRTESFRQRCERLRVHFALRQDVHIRLQVMEPPSLRMLQLQRASLIADINFTLGQAPPESVVSCRGLTNQQYWSSGFSHELLG